MRAIVAALFLIAPAIAQDLPRPPSFDVATIKLNKTGDRSREGGRLANGISIRDVSMTRIFQIGFGDPADRIVNAPKWFDDERYDIEARADRDIDSETGNLMLQSLLAERLKLSFHEEQRPIDIFALVVVKGGIQAPVAAAPSRKWCAMATKYLLFLADCNDSNMAHLIVYLQGMVRQYEDRPIVDFTGLKESYDLHIEFTIPKYQDQEGGLTLFSALNKLGLNLEPRKYPLPVMIIDHVERPSAN